MLLSGKRVCNGKCRKFRVQKPYGVGRYTAGQGRCQTCDIWVDHRGAHTKNGDPITDSYDGWFCNCCNYRIRRKPRNIEYKAKMRCADFKEESDNVDLSYFNKRRAYMLRDLGRAITKSESADHQKDYRFFLSNTTTSTSLELEFGVSMSRMFELAKTTDPPNKVSLIVEFERISHIVGHTPSKQDIERHSTLHIEQYENEFGSWEHLLERMGYDPWYRHDRELSETESDIAAQENEKVGTKPDTPTETLNDLREAIMNHLKDEPDMLQLFANIDQHISKLTVNQIRSLLSSMDH